MPSKLDEQCREIIVKAVCAKGQATTEQVHTIAPPREVADVLGCRVTGLRFNSKLKGDFVRVAGEYELQIWIAVDGDSELLRQRVDFHEDIALRDVGEGCLDRNPEVLAEVVSGPTVVECTVNKKGRLEAVVSLGLRVDVVGKTRLSVRVCETDDAMVGDFILHDDLV